MTSNIDDQLKHVVTTAENCLRTTDHSPFSPSAFEALKERVAAYIGELVNESIKVSDRFQADSVSAKHVEHASGYLVAGTGKRLSRHMGTVGGIIGGAGVSTLLSVATSNQPPSTLGILLSSGASIIGVFLIGFQIASD